MRTILKESGARGLKNYSTFLPCLVCGSSSEGGNTFHHVKTRGAGGSDDPWNLMPLDQKCHNEVHQIGLTSFSEKYQTVKTWLLGNGWEFLELTKKWSHYA